MLYRVTVSARIHSNETKELFRAAEFGADEEDLLLVVGAKPIFLDRLPLRIRSAPERFVVTTRYTETPREYVEVPSWIPCVEEDEAEAEDEPVNKPKKGTRRK